jgi:hypothetical protein
MLDDHASVAIQGVARITASAPMSASATLLTVRSVRLAGSRAP